MGERIRIPGPRDVRATLDAPGPGGDPDSAESIVVACPPHPQYGGSRTDTRLRAVSDALTDEAVACLRFDYGPWDGGPGEVRDAGSALAWAREHADRVGLFGYSFGGAVALLAAASPADAAAPPDALSVLSPPSTLGEDFDPVAAVDRLACPLQVVYGERDGVVDSVPIAERAEAAGHAVVAFPADHHFAGQTGRVGETVASFLVGHLRA
jgi:hypothetical protein